MTKVLILGSQGLLGSTLGPLLFRDGHEIIQHGRSGNSDVIGDLTIKSVTRDMISSVNPEVIINLAALTDVDRCERSSMAAYIGNVRVVENIVDGIQRSRKEIHLIQISTDQVYGGIGPHLETYVEPENIYGLTKYTGELVANLVSSTVLRTNFFGRSQCKDRVSLSDWMIDTLQQNKPLKVFTDVLFSPLSMETLSDLIGEIVDKNPVGVFNAGSENGFSKAEFAFSLATKLGLDCDQIVPISIKEAKLLARRPKDMRMNSDILKSTLNVRLPTLDEEIYRVKKDYE